MKALLCSSSAAMSKAKAATAGFCSAIFLSVLSPFWYLRQDESDARTSRLQFMSILVPILTARRCPRSAGHGSVARGVLYFLTIMVEDAPLAVRRGEHHQRAARDGQ